MNSNSSVGIGDVVEGKVVKITDFGAFVEFGEDKSGMIHISEVDHSFVTNIRDYLTEEQTVEVKVIAIKDDGKITLSMKQLMEPQPQAERRPARHGRDPRFEKMLKKYMKTSEESASTMKKNRQNKRPGGGR